MSDASDAAYSTNKAPFDYVANQDLPTGDSPYVMPRQTGTGLTRGTQTISGYIQIVNPVTGQVIIILGYKPGAF